MALLDDNYRPAAVWLLASWLLLLPGCGGQADGPARANRSKLVDPTGEKLQELGVSVKEQGGQVVFVDFFSTRNVSEGLPLLAELPHVKTLVLTGAKIGDDDLKHLSGLKELEELALNNTQITDEGLSQLGELPRLKKLNLNETHIGDKGLARLRNLTKLEGLNLHATLVTDAGLEHLAGLENLKYVWVSNTKVTDAGVATLREKLPNTLLMHGRSQPPLGPPN